MDHVEGRVRKVEDAVLLMHNDLKAIGKSTEKMSDALSKLTEIHTQQKILEERTELRHKELKDADKVLGERMDKVEGVQKKAAWTIVIIFLAGIGKLLMGDIK